MKKRGNPDNFIKEMTNEDSWKNFYKENNVDSKPKYKIELEKGVYLSEIKDRFILE